jgi:hypothetical protein
MWLVRIFAQKCDKTRRSCLLIHHQNMENGTNIEVHLGVPFPLWLTRRIAKYNSRANNCIFMADHDWHEDAGMLDFTRTDNDG